MASRKTRTLIKNQSKGNNADAKEGSAEHEKDNIGAVSAKNVLQSPKGAGRDAGDVESKDGRKKGKITKVNLKKSMGKDKNEHDQAIEGDSKDEKQKDKIKSDSKSKKKGKVGETGEQNKEKKTSIGKKTSIKLRGRKKKEEAEQVEKGPEEKKRGRKAKKEEEKEKEAKMKIEIKSKTKIESDVDKKKDADLVKIKKGGRKKAQVEENAVDEKVGPVAEKMTDSKKDKTKGKKKEKKGELDEKVKEKEMRKKKKKSVEGKDKEEKKEDKKMKKKEEESKKVKKSKKKENVVEEKEKPAPKQPVEAKKKALRKNEEGKVQSMSISLNKRIRKSDGSSAGKDTAKGALEKKEEQKMVTKKKEKQVAGLLGKTEDQKMVVKKKKGSYRPEELVDQEMAEEKKRGEKVVGLLEKTEDQKMIVGPTGAAEEDSAKRGEQMLGRDEGSRRKKSPRSAKAKKTPAEQPAEVSAAPIGNIFEDVEPIKKDDKSDLLTTKALEKMSPHKELGIENLVFNVYAKLYCFFGEEYTEAIEGTMLVCSDPLRVIFVRKGIKQVMFDSVINYDTKAVLRNARVTFGIIYEDKKKRLDLYAARFFKEEDAKMFYDFISNKK